MKRRKKRPSKDKLWKAIIVAEAATVFNDGRGVITSRALPLGAAKAWALSKLRALLDAEEEISQVMVKNSKGTIIELNPSTWHGDYVWVPHLRLLFGFKEGDKN